MVRRVIHLVYREVRGLHQAAYVLALFAFGSQLLAIVRDRMLAHTFGADTALDVYYAAFRIPDLLFVLFSSVLSIYVLLPFVSRISNSVSGAAAARVISQVFSLFLLLYSAIAALLWLSMPLLLPKLFPGLVEQMDMLVMISRILLLQPLLLGLSTLCGVVTQMGHRFVLYALSPLLYNLGIIFGVAVLYPLLGLSGLAVGVVLGAIGHLAVQVPFVRRSTLSFSLVSNFDWRLIGQIITVAIPRALTLSVNQITLLVLIGMASLLTAGSVAVFQFAFNLQSVPLAIIGMSYSVAAFPTLSRLYAERDTNGFARQLLTALRHIIFWSVPIIALVVVLRAHIVRVLLGSGSFNWDDTRLTAAVLAIFIISLTAQAVLLLLIRAFYAAGKTLVPLLTACISAAATVALAWWLMVLFNASTGLQIIVAGLFRLEEVTGVEIIVLALAFTFGQLLQVIMLMALTTRMHGVVYSGLSRLWFQSAAAAAVGAASAYMMLEFIVDGVRQDTFIGILLQGAAGLLAGVGAVILVYSLLAAPELQEIKRSFRAKLFKTDVAKPEADML